MLTEPQFQTCIAACSDDIRRAQQLRYDVFVKELNGSGPLVDHSTGREVDRFDDVSDHLILRDLNRREGDRVVGVYRLMNAAQAVDAGAFSSESEFDLDALKQSGKTLLELSRSCLHPSYRGGTAMFHMWQALSAHIIAQKIDILFGVASFHGADPLQHRHPLNLLFREHATTFNVPSRAPASLPDSAYDRRSALRATPALIKAYLRLGGAVGQGAFVDKDFNTTDVFMVLETDKLNARHKAIYTR